MNASRFGIERMRDLATTIGDTPPMWELLSAAADLERALLNAAASSVSERYIALLASPAPLGGICPACEAPLDEHGCRIGEHLVSDDPARTDGIAQVVEVFCGGTPVLPAHPCPCCAYHAGAPCNRP